ncbi:SOS response-associated peptidase [Paenibacillus chibensis]|uniref:SOS response-associated peptidase n=1 Tax=Paenibacillus chibensis TaxID=59846 RepID=UPI000FDB0510|nr:SOS response-associated peptidase [Paenibacillus chibensis]MEC0371425.1 SOS response-associated peptidase [Paenibacillus chibensis]
MCQRYSMTEDLPVVLEHFQVDRVMYYYKNRYNISPTQSAPVLLQQNGERVLDEFRWGFIPYWGKDAVNADLHTVKENPTYRKMIERQRCVIPCNGLYYWKREGKKMHPVRVVLKNRGMFGVAGLYEIWKDYKGEPLRTCTLVMANANRLIGGFEETRMPAILPQEAIKDWLNEENTSFHSLRSLLQTYDDDEMEAYPVTPLIDNDDHDHLECIREMDLRTAWVKR